MNKNKKLIAIFYFLIIILIFFIFFLQNKNKKDLELKISNLENNIYFNTWLYIINQKNSYGSLLQIKDMEYGYLTDCDTKYEINKNLTIKLKNIKTTLKYLEKEKTLKIYINIWNSKTKEYIFYSTIPEEVSKKISKDIIFILYQNLLELFNYKNKDITKNYIDYIEFNFKEKDNGTEINTAIILFERNKKKDTFSFDFLKIFVENNCIVYCDN